VNFRQTDLDGYANAFKNQPKQAKPHQKAPSMFDSKCSSSRDIPTVDEAEKKK